MAELKKVKDGSDVDAIRKHMDALSQDIQKVGAAMYSAPQSDQTNNGASSQASAKQDNKDGDKKDDQKPDDAEFKEKK